MRVQCIDCPWKVSSDPNKIPHGYCRVKHVALANTIARQGLDPWQLARQLRADLHIMACHKSLVGSEFPCVGWLDNQLNQGNNIPLRLAVISGRLDSQYRLDGQQHATFEDTLPGESDGT